MRLVLGIAFLHALASPAIAIEVDGRIDPQEWQGARHVTDFRLTQPLSRAPAPYPTEAWILATAEGLAIGFRSTQPASVPRTRQYARRDGDTQADRINVYLDFDADGRVGYNFTVLLSGSITDGTLTNENQYNLDWDGDWRHAVSEEGDTWSAELLIPWHIAPMQSADGEMRRLGISLDRVVAVTGERMSWPAITFTEPVFLSAFERIEVPNFSQSLLVVAPYVVGVLDAVGDRFDSDAGADVFWKPSGQFQLSGTLNPDFGQVESDRLVVNFGATETFFDDKRPFFVENQGFFEVPFGSLDSANRLLYTRRVGGPADDGSGAGDVTAAVKLNGSAYGVSYGAFAATEDDEAGRDFYAARATRDSDLQGIGAMALRVERPFLDRRATVWAVDHRWTPNAQWSIRTTAVASAVEQAGSRASDAGAQLRVDYDMGQGWRHQLFAVHLGGDLQLNDFGFLERNNFNYVRYEVARRRTDLPESSSFAAHDVRAAVSHRANDDGVHIADAWAVSRYSERRDGGEQYIEIAGWTTGYDDLLTRGNGLVRMPAKLYAFAERSRPRKGRWGYYGNVHYAAEGLGDLDDGHIRVYVEPRYYFSDALNVFAGMRALRNPEWLLWQGGNLLGTFRGELLELRAGLSWLISARQELQVRLEAIGLTAKANQAWRVAPDGTPVAVDEAIDDFTLRRLGFQVRYRYELAPLSSLYIAYVRGGSLLEQDAGPHDVGHEFRGAFDLRDSEQFLVKLSYRFGN